MWDRGIPWQRLCNVEAEPLIEWVNQPRTWIANASGVARIWDVPSELTCPILRTVLAEFDGRVCARELTLNRIEPGLQHGMHTDGQTSEWLTRVHVPLVTNRRVWHRFAGDRTVHFQVGAAYSFDTELRHEFGNDGDTPRIHLVFDVHRLAVE